MDQFYFEEGYIADGYFSIVREASATLDGAISATMTAEIAITSGYYIPDYIETGYFAEGTTHEASANIDTSANVAADVNINAVSTVTLNTSTSTTTDNERIRETDVTISGAMSASVSAVVNLVGDTGLIANISMLTDADRIRDNDVALSNIVNLSLQAAITSDFDSTLITATTLNTTAAVTRTVDSNLVAVVAFSASPSADAKGEAYVNSEFTLSVTTLNVQQAQADLSSAFTQYANAIKYQTKTLPFGRPNNFVPYFYDKSYNQWYPEGNYRFNDDVQVTYIPTGTTSPPFGTHTVSFVNSSPGFAGDFQALVSDFNNTIDIASNEDFTVNFYLDRYKDGNISFDYFNNERIYCSIGDTFNTIAGTQPNHYPAEDTSNKINIGVYRYASGNVVPYARLGTTQLFGNNLNYWQGGWITLTRESGTLKLYDYGNLKDSASNTNSISNINKAVLYPAEEGRSFLPAFDRFTFYKGKSIDGASFSNINDTFTNDIDTTVVFANFNQTLDDELAGFVLETGASLSSSFAQNASGGKLSDITTLNAGTFALGADISVTRLADASLNSESVIVATTGFLKNAVPDLDAVASQITVINKIGDYLVDIPMSATLNAEVNEIVQLDSALATNTTQIVDAVVTTDVVIDLTTTTTVTTNVKRIRDYDSASDSSFTITADVVEIIQLASNLNSAFIQETNGIIGVEAGASLDTSIALTADNVRVRFFDAQFDAFAATLTSGSKIGDYLVDIPMSASLTIDANVKSGSVIGIDSATSISADLDRYRLADASLDSAFIQETNGIIGVKAGAALDSNTSVNADAVKIVDAQIAISGAMSFATTVKANRAGEIDIETSATLVVDAVVTRGSTIELNTVANLNAQQTTIRDVNATFNTSATVTANGRIITLLEELEYTIPSENRTFAILSETREYQIEAETRTYTV